MTDPSECCDPSWRRRLPQGLFYLRDHDECIGGTNRLAVCDGLDAYQLTYSIEHRVPLQVSP